MLFKCKIWSVLTIMVASTFVGGCSYSRCYPALDMESLKLAQADLAGKLGVAAVPDYELFSCEVDDEATVSLETTLSPTQFQDRMGSIEDCVQVFFTHSEPGSYYSCISSDIRYTATVMSSDQDQNVYVVIALE